jgi:hypothetical protein
MKYLYFNYLIWPKSPISFNLLSTTKITFITITIGIIVISINNLIPVISIKVNMTNLLSMIYQYLVGNLMK